MARNQPAEPGRTRRCGRVLEQAIHDAVFAQLERVGYARLTMDGVAAEAHTGRATLYRRWADKDELVLDALCHALPSPVVIPLRGALRPEAATRLVANAGSAMMIYHSLTEGPVSDALLGEIVDEILLPLVRT
ncbi:helix-turn-helix domain-containing protein [Streptomyces sp. DSM 44917]|uniref:Helix-turn-helix domain-containing protein n=1 Tax=Streptomyces boetiae TaxID=3075541 RepID=A0ABU2L4J5_9ACTN|nr:helix-turn-helix domain-containing protein [Streptomyces sp. DSM 44917]MDT0306482.1 helix-turn-helix domain-containing protein [Streptomyces sp. DSM 44917]